MKTIVLARHAKSDWSFGVDDFDRPLNPRGLADAPRMGKLLAAYDFQPDYILSSPAMRAKTTAEVIAKTIEFPKEIDFQSDIYGHGPGTILGLIQGLPDEHESVMVFGHNPITENLVSFLLQMRGGITIPTCGMVCLEMSCNQWSQVSPIFASLKWFLIPKLIKRYKG